MSFAKELMGLLHEQRSNWFENVKAKYLGKVKFEYFRPKGTSPSIASVINHNNVFPHPDDYFNLMAEQINIVANSLNSDPVWKSADLEGRIEFFKNRGEGDIVNLKLLTGRYGLLHNYSYELSDEWKKIADADRSEKVRNVIFRFIQTLAVGTAFVLVLEFAHKLNIPLILFK